MKRARAYTLMEMILVAGLTALTGSLFFVNMKGSAKKAGAQALAQALAEELRQARGLAIAAQSPVGVVFPGGGVPHSTSFYQLEGWTAPRVTRVKQFRGEFPGCDFFQGSWPVDTSQLRTTAGVNAANPAVLGDKWASWNLESWLPASSRQDYCFVFTPDGRVRTNDLPSFDRAFHILVCNGVGQYSGGAAPANTRLSAQPAYFQPQLVGQAYTVSLDVSGSVSIAPGVLAASAGAVQEVRAVADVATPGSGRSLDSRVAPVPSTPQVSISSTTPDPAAGVDVTVAPDGYITLQASVVDTANSGERLYCVWQVTPEAGNVGVGPSDYSIPVAPGRGAAMDWDAVNNRWTSTWQWRPPQDGRGGDRFNLQLIVQDSSGTNLTAAIQRRVSVCPPGEIYYGAGVPIAFFSDLQRMNLDGSGKRALHTPPFSQANPSPAAEAIGSCSADGNRIAYGSARDLVPPDPGFQVYITDREGSMTYRVSGPVGDACESMALSPFGNLVAYKQMSGGNVYLRVVNVDPDPARRAEFTVANLGPDGGWFLGGNARRLLMGDDRISWDMRIDQPAHAGRLYFSQLDTPGLTPHIYTAQIQLDAQGRPVGFAQAPALLGSIPGSAYAPQSFSRVKADGTREDFLFYTIGGGTPKTGFLRFGPPDTPGVLEAGTSPGDVNPTAFVEGDQLRFLVSEKIPVTLQGRIVRFTPPFADAPAADRSELVSPTVGGFNAFNPCFAPARP